MPNIAISALPVATSQAGADVLPIVQATTSTTKQLSVANLFTSPTFVTPALGTVASGNISACTSTSMVMVTPVLGTPTSGVVTNLTGTASININGTVGATTPAAGAFTTVSATGVATFAAGTVALPAITTSGDTNTGVYFPAADTIAFTEGGVEAMRINSSGNVGIGTASPAVKLDVSGTTYFRGAGIIQVFNGNTIAQVEGGQNLTFDSAYAAMVFQTISTERMRIDSSGNVGIGATANASAILDAQSTTKGVRMPNMTTVQKNAIASPAAGLMVFDTTLAKLCVYTTAWETITSV